MIPTEVPDGLFQPVKLKPLLVGSGRISGVPKLKLSVAVETVPPFASYVTKNGAGVALAEEADATLLPVAFVATAVNVYAVPFVRPVIVQVVAETIIVHVAEPGDAVTK